MTSKRLRSGSVAYYWSPPTKFRDQGCPLEAEALGTAYAEAKSRCDQILNPLLDAWATGTEKQLAALGTFDWLVQEFQKCAEYRDDIGDETRRNYSRDLQLIADYQLKNGDRFGHLRLQEINRLATKRLFQKLSEGRESRARAAMRASRRAWNVLSTEHSEFFPAENPFSNMQIKSQPISGNRAATWDELMSFIEAADDFGSPSIGTAALIGYEWLLRSVDIVATLAWSHYRPPQSPNAVLIKHSKTNQEAWLPLIDEDNEKLFPELEVRLSKTAKYGPLIIMNDGPERRSDVVKPWRLDWFRHRVKQVIEHANLPRDLTFTSFRHGGFTEAGNAEVSEAGIRALGQHKTNAMQSVYVKRTERQRQNAMTKRRNERFKK